MVECWTFVRFLDIPNLHPTSGEREHSQDQQDHRQETERIKWLLGTFSCIYTKLENVEGVLYCLLQQLSSHLPTGAMASWSRHLRR